MLSARRLTLVLALLLTSCSSETPEARAAGDGTGAAQRTLAMVPKGTTHNFWKMVESGAKPAAEALGVELIWKGPLEENDRAQQIQLVQQLVSQGIDGLLLAPLDHRALAAPVRAAVAGGVPVVIFDSGLDAEPGVDFTSYVATDNMAGGRMAGEHLASLLEGQGKVVLMRYIVGSASTDERERGFLEVMGEHAGIEVLVDNRYAGVTAGEAKTTALNMLDDLRQADGIFCPNETACVGMLLALKQEGLAGQVRFVGFDSSPPLVAGLAAGEIDALVLQDPRAMGRRAVEAMVAHLDGQAVEAVIDTGVVLATGDNMGEATIAALLE